MAISKRELELHEEDLLGYSEKDVACHQCGSCCGRRAGRVLDGKPLIMGNVQFLAHFDSGIASR